MDSSYKLNLAIGWNGPHSHISLEKKDQAIRSFIQLIDRCDPTTRAGIQQMAQVAHAWYLRHCAPIPDAPNVTLDVLHFSLVRKALQITEIDAASGEILYIVRDLR